MAIATTPPLYRATMVVTAVSAVVLAWFAASADATDFGASRAYIALDLAVGFAFVLGSIASAGAPSEGVIMGAVGPVWLAGSVFASARSLHQGVLAVALLAFPSGRVVGVSRRVLVIVAIVVVLQVVPQLGVAALFAAVALLAVGSVSSTRTALVYPAACGISVAVTLGFSWWAVRNSAAVPPIVLYSAILIGVAVGFPFASRAVVRSSSGLTDRMLGDANLAGLSGLETVLADILRDPHLRILRWDAAVSSDFDPQDQDHETGQLSRGLTVLDGEKQLARVITSAPALADPGTVGAVVSAVRLAVANLRLHEEEMQQAADLEASRARVLAAADEERQRVADRLRSRVSLCLQGVLEKLDAAAVDGPSELSVLIDLAAGEVAAAATDIERIVAGAPPHPLGQGRLQAAITSLLAQYSARVTLLVSGDVAAETTVETALYYACSEGLANCLKHSGAAHVQVVLQRVGDTLSLSVSDDGRGGADPAGSGLQGLTDRLASAGGQLTVHSPQGGGTTMVASVPNRSG